MHYKRKRSKTSQSRRSWDRRKLKENWGEFAADHYIWLGRWPRWHDIVFHRRPKRRLTKTLLYKVLVDYFDPETINWPLGNHKPHKYYW